MGRTDCSRRGTPPYVGLLQSDESDPDRLRSTFPIPAGKIRLRKLRTLLWSPLSLLISHRWPPWSSMPGSRPHPESSFSIDCLRVLVAGVAGATVLEDLIRESNSAQDDHLALRARRPLPRRTRSTPPPSVLPRGETAHRAGPSSRRPAGAVTDEIREIETLTDAIVFGVADQLEHLLELDGRITKAPHPLAPGARARIEAARQEIAARIREAYTVLDETWRSLGLLLDPTCNLDVPDTRTTPSRSPWRSSARNAPSPAASGSAWSWMSVRGRRGPCRMMPFRRSTALQRERERQRAAS